MKKVFIILLLTGITPVFAQKDLEKTIRDIDRRIDSVVLAKSKAFQEALDSTGFRLQQGEISGKDADFRRRQLAKLHAADLDYSVYKLTYELRRAAKDDSARNRHIDISLNRVYQHRKREKKEDKKEYTFLELATGINNLLTGDRIDEIDESPYRLWQSRFFELGIISKNRIAGKWLHVKYGLSSVWNTLKPEGNIYHEVINDSLQMISHTYDLSRSKLRSIWLKVPLSVEMNLPDGVKNHLRLSAGIYGKFRLATKQKIAYDDDAGDHYRQVIKSRYMMNNFAYGVSAGIGVHEWILYVNYDLKSLMDNDERQLISLGIKYEI